MRELKFRAWFPALNKMAYSDLEFTRCLIYCSRNDKEGHETNEDYLGFTKEYEQKYCEIMQFTGLKDKNGVEICEGDIIKDKLTRHWFKIEFSDGRYKGDFIPHDNIAGGYCIDSLHKMDMCFYEVIGNIFENSELIKSTTT